MTEKHKEKRIKFSPKNLKWEASLWKNIIFTDKPKLKLDGPDSLQYYWYDLRNKTGIYYRRINRGGSVIIWSAIYYQGMISLSHVDGWMN